MTLCIAARCFDANPEMLFPSPPRYNVNTAVISWDTHVVLDESVETDEAHKFAVITPLWCCLIAGNLAQGHAIAHAVGRELSRPGELNELTVQERIRAGAKGYIIGSYISERFGKAYDDVFAPNSGVEKDVRARILSEASAYALKRPFPRQELIFVGWVSGRFMFYEYRNGKVRSDNTQLTIGTGSYLATVMLTMGQYSARLDDIVYRVYEAQRIGAEARDVGREARFAVLRYDVRQKSVVSQSIEARDGGFLDETFKSMMPKRPEPLHLERTIIARAWDAYSFLHRKNGIGINERGQETDRPKGDSTMANRKTPRKSMTPKGSASPRQHPIPQGANDDFDRTVSALFQVPKSAVDEAEAASPKRTRKKG